MGANVSEMVEPVEITGEKRSWIRARMVVIENVYNKIPTLISVRERIEISPMGEKHDPLPESRILMTDPNTSFQMRHPLTGELLGSTMTFGEVQAVLYSIFVAKEQGEI